MSQQGFRHNILEKRLIRFDKMNNVIYGNITRNTTNSLWIWYVEIAMCWHGIDLLTFRKHMLDVFDITIYICILFYLTLNRQSPAAKRFIKWNTCHTMEKVINLFELFISIYTNEISFHFYCTPVSWLWYILKQRRDCLMSCKTSLQGILYIRSGRQVMFDRKWLQNLYASHGQK